MTCPHCGSDNPAGKKFCGECGTALANRCAQCGADNPPNKKFCGECGASLAAAPTRSPPPPPRSATEAGVPTEPGERRHPTALFCDLVGATDIAARLDPEEWHRISKAYQEAAATAVTRFGGHVDKFLGDGLVCFFGVPEAHEDDAERAVRAGLAIVEPVHALNRNTTAPEAHLRARIGMHTGSAVVAPGGGHSSYVFGDPP